MCKNRTYTPLIECLEGRDLLSAYFWRPNPDLPAAQQILMSDGRNWTNGNQGGNVRYLQNQKPGLTDELIYDRNSMADCTIDANSNSTFASIMIDHDFGLSLHVRQSITFNSILANNQRTPRSSLDSARIVGYDIPVAIGPPSIASITFEGSRLELFRPCRFDHVTIRNSDLNELEILGRTEWLNGALLANHGGATWNAEDGDFDLAGSRIINFGRFEMKNTGNISSFQNSSLQNFGILVKAGNGDIRVAANFSNHRFLEIEQGAFELSGSLSTQIGPLARTRLGCNLTPAKPHALNPV